MTRQSARPSALVPVCGAFWLGLTLLLRPAPALADGSLGQCRASMPQGAVCACRLADLHPTQLAIGRLHVQELEQEGFDALAKHVAKPGEHARVVFGPAGALYIVDGHHHAAAMLDLQPAGSTVCEIAGDPAAVSADPEVFWSGMDQRRFAWLKGNDGSEHPGVFPPASLAELPDDPFRSVAGWLERDCNVRLTGDYAEFRLAGVLRADPKAVTPHSAADRAATLKEAKAYLHDPANRGRIADDADADRFAGCR